MRLLRSSNNKENIHVSAKSVSQREKIQQLRVQLKSAFAEIALLKEKNHKLTQRAESCQKQLENQKLLKEEIQFMKQQEMNVRQQLVNFQEINNKLRLQLQKVEVQNEMLKKQANMRSKMFEKDEERQTTRRLSQRQSFVEESLPLSNRITERSFRANSIMSDRHKSNHCSTPKNKMNIKFEELIPNQLQSRKRVFL